MNIKIPFESELKFKTPICEITKMSLEHEYTLNGNLVLGNFMITGEYRPHEVSVNTETFDFTLPFQVDIVDNVDLDTIDFDIVDFTYDILNKESLKVYIEYRVSGEVLERNEIEELFEDAEEVDFEEELSKIDEELENIDEEVLDREETIIEEEKEIPVEMEEDAKVESVKEEERDITEENKNVILNNIEMDEDTFVSYHVHIVKESETIESICALYNTNSNILSDYNDISDLSIGDKVIIPFLDE